MQPRQFLNDVNLAFYIETPAGNGHKVSVFASRKHRETQAGKNTAYLESAQFFTENAVHFSEIKLHRSEIKTASDHVDDSASERSSARGQYQFGDSVSRRNSRFEI